MRDLRRAFEEVIGKFNEFRSPEAVAELIHIEGDVAVVRMRGPFCASCGLYDYFEDLAWRARDLLGEEVVVEAADRVAHDEYLALYRVKEEGAKVLRGPERPVAHIRKEKVEDQPSSR
ncbi:MAG: hypothetical protein DRO01_06545 [Thermoproteota archaeon]|nr:MAG: hypothetical protein DRO01_06545 [Candidatus Korarchaeota archaeon]